MYWHVGQPAASACLVSSPLTMQVRVQAACTHVLVRPHTHDKSAMGACLK